MFVLKGYYDGTTIKLLEEFGFEKNQKLIITILDEFIKENEIEEQYNINKKTVRGVLSKYANKDLINQEEGAWEREVAKNYDNY